MLRSAKKKISGVQVYGATGVAVKSALAMSLRFPRPRRRSSSWQITRTGCQRASTGQWALTGRTTSRRRSGVPGYCALLPDALLKDFGVAIRSLSR